MHDHSHSSDRRTIGIALAITGTVFLAEVFGAWWTDSLALIVDAGHMAVDTSGLILAFFAATLVLRPATSTHTWGFQRAEVISAGLQALFLAGVGCYAIIEAIRRLIAPPEIDTTGLLAFGIIGLLGNLLSMWFLSRSESHSLNLKAASLEVLNDALGSVAVIVSALITSFTGFLRADAIASLLIAVLIIPRALHILRESGHILMETTPPGFDLEAVRAQILAVPGVIEVHDLHASRISTGLPVLTAHVVLEEARFSDGSIPEILRYLQTCVGTEHSTFQFEPPSVRAQENLH